MAVKLISALIVLSACVLHIKAYSTGAPKEVCEDLMPRHNEEAQTSAFPYSVKTSATKIKPGDKVKVTISSDKGLLFKGFIVQARVGDVPYGTFEAAQNINLLDCHGGKKNSATHTSSEEKKSITLTWTAPQKLQGVVKFTVTVAQNGGVFWVKQKSEPITVQ